MFKFLKNLSGKTKKIILSVGTGVVAASAMAIAACAEGAQGADGSATTLDISTIVNSAGSTLQTQFVALVCSPRSVITYCIIRLYQSLSLRSCRI